MLLAQRIKYRMRREVGNAVSSNVVIIDVDQMRFSLRVALDVNDEK